MTLRPPDVVLAPDPRRPALEHSVGRAKGGYRPDVQGLRAIAVMMVVVYHLYPSLLPGGFAGVDVFFAISGFLITGHLLSRYQRTGRVDLLDFWGRRARRLIPAAALVLTVTWLAARVVLPITRLPDTARQVLGSALYYQNWVLAHNAVDYLKQDEAPTPVQHFWSLSVEEQFYLVWPLIFVVGALVTLRSTRRAARFVVLGLALAVVVASLAYSVYDTRTNPAAAYFVTTTRIWELALGGVLALSAQRAGGVLSRQGWLGWVGLAMVVASGFVLSGKSAFPGTVALLPVVGAVLLIAGGSSHGRLGPSPITSVPVMVFLGDISYSLYLWHWPIIVLWKVHSGHRIGVVAGPVILAISIALSWLTKVFVEDTVRRSAFVTAHRGRSLATALVAVVPAALVVSFLSAQPAPVHGALGTSYPGAAVLAGDVTTVASVSALPRLIDAPKDFTDYGGKTCQVGQYSSTPITCTFGDTTDPTLTIALVGDSVAGQWLVPLELIAPSRHWKIVTELRSLCAWSATMETNLYQSTPYTACHDWGAAVMDDLVNKVKPDVVITSDRPVLGTPAHPKVDAATMSAIGHGMATYWQRLIDHGIAVVPVRESPEMHQDIPDCLASHSSADACSRPRSGAIDQQPPTVVATEELKGAVDLVDMNSLICAPVTCSAVVGNIVVYRDWHHLTDTYTRTLAPYLERKLLATRALKP